MNRYCFFALLLSYAPECTGVRKEVETEDPPYPGPDALKPRIHLSPDCLHVGGWHDMAAALTHEGVHHAFQGCPASGGWSHSTSTDLVHWKTVGIDVHTLSELYQGMESDDSPCSGFMTVDDDGTPCAGFRQCSSSSGTTGLNPAAHAWDVPMELRCARDEDRVTNFSDPIWMYPVYFYRALPYDPVRPWKDRDGKWYSAYSTDGCNATTKQVPCAAGGQLELLVSDSLRGGEWTQLAPMFTTNTTMSGRLKETGSVTREFVTSGYFGNLPGDPAGGSTRVVTQNNFKPTFWVGTQANGSTFEAMWDKVGAVGHYDYGSLTMARTLGGDVNQVVGGGRKVLIGWIGGGSPASQSLARDLSLSNDYELLQQFVPELKSLRIAGSKRETSSGLATNGSLQMEIYATFSCFLKPTQAFGVRFSNGSTSTFELSIDCTEGREEAPCMAHAANDAGPILPVGATTFSLHAIVDHQIVESIFNNRTAIVSYLGTSTMGPSSFSDVELFGVEAGSGVTANLSAWSLRGANNKL